MNIEERLRQFHWEHPGADLKLRVTKDIQLLEAPAEQHWPSLSTRLAAIVRYVGSTLGVGAGSRP